MCPVCLVGFLCPGKKWWWWGWWWPSSKWTNLNWIIIIKLVFCWWLFSVGMCIVCTFELTVWQEDTNQPNTHTYTHQHNLATDRPGKPWTPLSIFFAAVLCCCLSQFNCLFWSISSVYHQNTQIPDAQWKRIQYKYTCTWSFYGHPILNYQYNFYILILCTILFKWFFLDKLIS